ncbi:MAG: hypothetical protein WC510_04335 [Candidatus Omnitrophota bacterium]
MRKRQGQRKGVVLLMVVTLSLIIFIWIMGLLFVLRSNVYNLVSFEERAKAYYLCETGVSVAILDIANGKIGTTSGKWTERQFEYEMGGINYFINYKVRKQNGRWYIDTWVDQSSGFSREYTLAVGGQRAFPIFIRGFGGR